MLEFLYTLGQAACAMLVMYGGFLAMTIRWLAAQPKTPPLSPELEDELLLLKHIRTDA